MNEKEDLFNEFAKKEEFTIIRELGKGGFGSVKEIKLNKNNKIYAAKLLDENEIGEKEAEMIQGFKGPGIVKITKVSNYNTRYLIIMEKSVLKDLNSCINHLHKNLLNLIFYPFEKVGNNLLRFFIKNLLNGMEVLNRYNYAHFDIKPQNILIFQRMIAKLIDFSLLRNIDKLKDEQIPNTYKVLFGTHGYIPPEIYQNKAKVDKETAIKYDYFSLGATIFALKFGDKMIDPNYFFDKKDNEVEAEIIIDLLEKARDKIKSKPFPDKGFNEFLCSLIQYKSKERPDFEEIYRNKWVHKNSEEINQIFEINELDEEKLMLELDKSDFLLSKKEYIKNKKENFAHKNNKKINRNKFIFKKKSKK